VVRLHVKRAADFARLAAQFAALEKPRYRRVRPVMFQCPPMAALAVVLSHFLAATNP
jgi:hypothetical protein